MLPEVGPHPALDKVELEEAAAGPAVGVEQQPRPLRGAELEAERGGREGQVPLLELGVGGATALQQEGTAIHSQTERLRNNQIFNYNQ